MPAPMRRVTTLLWLTGLLCVRPVAAQTLPVTMPADSVVAAVRRALLTCDSAWRELEFVQLTHERKLDSDGNLDKETTYKERVYARHGARRAFLEGMWEDGRPVSDKTLQNERADRQDKWRKREKSKAEHKADKDDDEASAEMLEPFKPKSANDYDFPSVTADTLDGHPAWKVEVAPRRESEDLVRGAAWVDATTFRAVAESYEPAKLPGGVKGMNMRVDYRAVAPGCAMPEHLLLRAHGRALVFIKFNIEFELAIDSVQVNPGLPDSLFVLPPED